MGRPLKWQANPVIQQIVAKNRKIEPADKLHWLDLQKTDRYTWRQIEGKGSEPSRSYYRRLGVVESLFDSDGELWCGRADLHQSVRFEVKTKLDEAELRERLVLAWTLMRHSHVLLSCHVAYAHEVGSNKRSKKWTDRCFVYHWPRNTDEALQETRKQVVFVADKYPQVDEKDFAHHVRNSSRALSSRESLSRLYVLPFKESSRGTTEIRLVPVLAHQITDGLTTYRWIDHFSQIMNMNKKELVDSIDVLLNEETAMISRLPPAQEVLYPLRSFNPARERWHWLLTRILRHVRKAPPAAFQNPLRRDQPLSSAVPLSKTFGQVLNYSQIPPLNCGHIGADLWGRSASNMRQLCKDSGISVGSGCFTLVAMVMMRLEEERNPEIALNERLPFVGSFPVNPRPFFSGELTTGKENSCMLAFSDGVTLPFLPSDLNFVGRFKLLGRLAHKQLRQYQKRKPGLRDELDLGSRSPSQLIPSLYCSTLERMEGRMNDENRAEVNVQGGYPATLSPTLATCGISSVGDVSGLIAPLKANLNSHGTQEIVAELKGFSSVVRPRDGEFLVGSIGTKDHQGFGVAFDANAIDPARVDQWKHLMESMLDQDLNLAGRAKL